MNSKMKYLSKQTYYKNMSHEFSVRCQIIENASPLIDLTLTVPTEEEAVAVTNNWNKNHQEVYALIMQHLL